LRLPLTIRIVADDSDGGANPKSSIVNP